MVSLLGLELFVVFHLAHNLQFFLFLDYVCIHVFLHWFGLCNPFLNLSNVPLKADQGVAKGTKRA